MRRGLDTIRDQFDIALISAGGWGHVLLGYVRRDLNKSAVYVGGALALHFGIVPPGAARALTMSPRRASRQRPQAGHRTMNNPALETVKAVVAVLELDATAKEEVATLRRNLLKLISVREFAQAARFVNPCLSF